METMCYYSKAEISLEDIAQFAEAQGYKTGWLRLPTNQPPNKLHLNIIFGTEKWEWWQWHEETIEEIWCDTEEERERLCGLGLKRILLFRYHQSSLTTIAKFLKAILLQYDGWLDCEGDVLNLYDAQNIDQIVNGCQ